MLTLQRCSMPHTWTFAQPVSVEAEDLSLWNIILVFPANKKFIWNEEGAWTGRDPSILFYARQKNNTHSVNCNNAKLLHQLLFTSHLPRVPHLAWSWPMTEADN